MRYTPSGTGICTLSIATDLGFGEKKKTSYFDVKIFGKQAESTSQYLSKGNLALFAGRLEQERWEDKNTGDKRSKVVIIANEVKFMPKATQNSEPVEPEVDDWMPW